VLPEGTFLVLTKSQQQQQQQYSPYQLQEPVKMSRLAVTAYVVFLYLLITCVSHNLRLHAILVYIYLKDVFPSLLREAADPI